MDLKTRALERVESVWIKVEIYLFHGKVIE